MYFLIKVSIEAYNDKRRTNTYQENNTLENHMGIKLNVEQVVAQLCEFFRCELVKNTPHLSKDEIISAFWGECIASNS